MARFDRAGDEPPARALVRGFGFVDAFDCFFIAELAPPSESGQASVRQLEDVGFRAVNPLAISTSGRRSPQGHWRRWLKPFLRVLLAAAHPRRRK